MHTRKHRPLSATTQTTHATRPRTTRVAVPGARPARSLSEKDQVYALRYRVYRAMGVIEPSAYQRLREPHDVQANSLCYLIEHGRAPVGSLRISVHLNAYGRGSGSKRSAGLIGRALPCLDRFRASMERHVGPDASIVEGSHLVLDQPAAHLRPQVESIWIKLLLANADAHEADWVVVTSPVEQAARLCRHSPLRRLAGPCRSAASDLDLALIGCRTELLLAHRPDLKPTYFESLRLAL